MSQPRFAWCPRAGLVRHLQIHQLEQGCQISLSLLGQQLMHVTLDEFCINLRGAGGLWEA